MNAGSKSDQGKGRLDQSGQVWDGLVNQNNGHDEDEGRMREKGWGADDGKRDGDGDGR